MFRKMRRAGQQLGQADVDRILKAGITGVLGVRGDGGYPYTVPLNYAYEDGRIYLHCARDGHKLDALRDDDRVSFCVITADRVAPERFTTDFESVIAFGRGSVVADTAEVRRAMLLLCSKYAPGPAEERDAEMSRSRAALAVVRIDIEHATAKVGGALAGRATSSGR